MANDTYTLITTMKNEGAFLVEWVAHHKVLGFDNLLICTNDCEDTTTLMVRRLEKMGLARLHQTRYRPGQSIQLRALRQALQYDVVKDADWLYICDADEFLASRIGDGSARALIAAASPDAEAVCVPWRGFGTGGQNQFRPGRITRQFTLANATHGPRAAKTALPKTLFRGDTMQYFRRLGVHTPVISDNLRRKFRREIPGGISVTDSPAPLQVQADYSRAQINHYRLRSLDSFLVKSARGKVNHINDKMEYSYWADNDINDEACDLIRRYDAETERWMADLLSDRRLNTLHNRAVRWHQEKIGQIHADPAFADMIARIEANRDRETLAEVPLDSDYTGGTSVQDDDDVPVSGGKATAA